MPLSFADIINIDITVYLDGFHGDCSKTYAVGDIDNKAKKLIKTTEECLNIGIDLCHPGRIMTKNFNFTKKKLFREIKNI